MKKTIFKNKNTMYTPYGIHKSIWNKYKALIINGYVRDIEETKKFAIGLIALGTCPLRNFEKTNGERDIELKFGGVTFNNGDFLYADEDGVIVCSEELDASNLKKRY